MKAMKKGNPMKTMKAMKAMAPMKAMKKGNPMKTMKAMKAMAPMKAMQRVVVGTALMGKQTNEKWIHVDSRYVKEIWVQVEVVQNKALVKVWKKND